VVRNHGFTKAASRAAIAVVRVTVVALFGALFDTVTTTSITHTLAGTAIVVAPVAVVALFAGLLYAVTALFDLATRVATVAVAQVAVVAKFVDVIFQDAVAATRFFGQCRDHAARAALVSIDAIAVVTLLYHRDLFVEQVEDVTLEHSVSALWGIGELAGLVAAAFAGRFAVFGWFDFAVAADGV
jgi:hypothetical protein